MTDPREYQRLGEGQEEQVEVESTGGGIARGIGAVRGWIGKVAHKATHEVLPRAGERVERGYLKTRVLLHRTLSKWKPYVEEKLKRAYLETRVQVHRALRPKDVRRKPRETYQGSTKEFVQEARKRYAEDELRNGGITTPRTFLDEDSLGEYRAAVEGEKKGRAGKKKIITMAPRDIARAARRELDGILYRRMDEERPGTERPEEPKIVPVLVDSGERENQARTSTGTILGSSRSISMAGEYFPELPPASDIVPSAEDTSGLLLEPHDDDGGGTQLADPDIGFPESNTPEPLDNEDDSDLDLSSDGGESLPDPSDLRLDLDSGGSGSDLSLGYDDDKGDEDEDVLSDWDEDGLTLEDSSLSLPLPSEQLEEEGDKDWSMSKEGLPSGPRDQDDAFRGRKFMVDVSPPADSNPRLPFLDKDTSPPQLEDEDDDDFLFPPTEHEEDTRNQIRR